MFRKISKLLVCAIALLLPLIVGIAVVMAKPAQQTTYSYYFAGKVEVQNKRGLPSRRLDVQISCDGLVTTTIQSDLDWNWSGMLNLPTDMATCDVQLLLPPGYQGVGVVVPPESADWTVISPTHVRYLSMSPGMLGLATFSIQKPMTTTQTPHFSIEWYTDKKDPDYPDDKRGTDGAAYINVVANALEDAWSVYETLAYTMPPPTYGRTDQRITVHVEQGQGNGKFSLPSRVPELEFPVGVDGLSFGGQFWIHN